MKHNRKVLPLPLHPDRGDVIHHGNGRYTVQGKTLRLIQRFARDAGGIELDLAFQASIWRGLNLVGLVGEMPKPFTLGQARVLTRELFRAGMDVGAEMMLNAVKREIAKRRAQ